MTDADRRTEEQIVRTFFSAYPPHRILWPKSVGGRIDRLTYRWIIDPLDGTTNFARLSVLFGIGWAGVQRRIHSRGGVGSRTRRAVYRYRRAGGLPTERASMFHPSIHWSACTTGHRLCVQRSQKRPTITSITFTPFTTGWSHSSHQFRPRWISAMSRQGRFDGYWEVKLSPWDMAAGIVLVREAQEVSCPDSAKPTSRSTGRNWPRRTMHPRSASRRHSPTRNNH